MNECRIIIPGEPSTDHRARSSARIVGGKARTRHHRSPEYSAWKERCRLAGLSQRPRGWVLDGYFAVDVMGYLTSNRPDADNLRGCLDALQGVLWSNDRRCKPVTFDYAIDKASPRVELHVVRFDPKRWRPVRTIHFEAIGGAS